MCFFKFLLLNQSSSDILENFTLLQQALIDSQHGAFSTSAPIPSEAAMLALVEESYLISKGRAPRLVRDSIVSKRNVRNVGKGGGGGGGGRGIYEDDSNIEGHIQGTRLNQRFDKFDNENRVRSKTAERRRNGMSSVSNRQILGEKLVKAGILNGSVGKSKHSVSISRDNVPIIPSSSTTATAMVPAYQPQALAVSGVPPHAKAVQAVPQPQPQATAATLKPAYQPQTVTISRPQPHAKAVQAVIQR